jgi:hypothetical protein
MDTNTFLLQEVIDDLLKAETSLVSPLMKLNYFGRLIKNTELLEYTNLELNGYAGDEAVHPPYRKSLARLMITIQAGQYSHLKELPIMMLPEPFNDQLRYLEVSEGVGVLEQMAIKFQDKDADQLVKPLPMEMLSEIQSAASKLYKSQVRTVVVAAQIISNPNVVIQILSTVRTKLLAFIMELGENFGYNIEISSFRKDQAINNQTINNFMKTEINNTGDGNVTNTGNNSQVNATINITKGDLKKLNETLKENGIEDADIEELNTIVQTETPDFENQKLGEKANGWILNIIGKTLSGIGKIGTGVSANLLATLIKHYYGIGL